jgi:TetR/AcrR family transcriptional regulator, transcriptional repressor for nem operon
MPLSKGHKRETRQRVVKTAARAFRAGGINGVGVAGLMRQAGLTHGGFYAHFRSKDDLVAAACAEGMLDSSTALLAGMKEATAPDAGLSTFIRSYLSRSHRDDPATGCVIASLGPEIVRGSPQTRHAFTEALKQYVAELAACTAQTSDEVENAEAREDAMYLLLAGMAGALLVSRAVDDGTISDRILRAARRFYTKYFADSGGNSAARPIK